MPRKKTGRKRGRPRKLHGAKRRQSTREGRRTGYDPVDTGSPLLRRHKRRLTGDETIELSAAGILLGHGCIDRVQYDTLGNITLWLQRLARSLGPHGIGVDGLWASITGALVAIPGVVVPSAVGEGADHARYVLGRTLRQLDGSRDLVVALAENRTPDIVVRAVENRLTAADEAALDRLRAGLDVIGGRR
jgi:hypothetical protein